ncbi:MFS transporter [Candidatus Avelusimicrobium sp.]|uniref:MFS transporter n=1 Tax=Candidatus Avelusimicrobium sp. TaxID=3048833 RepID=UPI003D7E881A
MKKTPWTYIPSLYLAEGLPYIIINTVSTVLYADLGFSNDKIAFWTGWLYLPWILKMFWSPLVDAKSTKRRWLLGAQMVLAGLFLLLAGLTALEAFRFAQGNSSLTFFTLSLFGFLAGAFVSATLDIATDGYYLLALTPQEQSKFVGIRTIFYRLAMILGSGVLISATAALGDKTPETSWNLVSWPYNWAVMFGFLGVLFMGFVFYHAWMLPKPEQDKPVHKNGAMAWADSFKTYFTQKNIVYILLFILLYRLGDALLEKMVPLFLLKPAADGALGMSVQNYGLIKGTLGLGAVVAGNLAGGWLLGKFGFKKCIWPFAVILILPNFFYAYMAWAKPGLTAVATLITLEHLGNGLAMMAFSVFIMYVSQGVYKTSHYAISTGIMALGMMVPSMLSGWLQMRLGYETFFLVASFISLVTVAVVPLTFKIKSIEETEAAFRAHKHSLEDAQ